MNNLESLFGSNIGLNTLVSEQDPILKGNEDPSLGKFPTTNPGTIGERSEDPYFSNFSHNHGFVNETAEWNALGNNFFSRSPAVLESPSNWLGDNYVKDKSLWEDEGLYSQSALPPRAMSWDTWSPLAGSQVRKPDLGEDVSRRRLELPRNQAHSFSSYDELMSGFSTLDLDEPLMHSSENDFLTLGPPYSRSFSNAHPSRPLSNGVHSFLSNDASPHQSTRRSIQPELFQSQSCPEHVYSLEHTTAPYTEHPHGEHPSRTLFVRNINSNVEDEELRALFEAHGPIRSMYTQCKHRGFVMISYFDIRHSKNAMRHLQGKLLRRRKLDIHYSIPKDNPSEKDQNQGTLVVFNLDPSTTNNDLKLIFGQYGEIKEIRETPNKKHHKFIEFYDVRDAERAMKQLNKTEINSKKIKIEPSRPGGARKNLAHQMQMTDVDEYSRSPPSVPVVNGLIPNTAYDGYMNNGHSRHMPYYAAMSHMPHRMARGYPPDREYGHLNRMYGPLSARGPMNHRGFDSWGPSLPPIILPQPPAMNRRRNSVAERNEYPTSPRPSRRSRSASEAKSKDDVSQFTLFLEKVISGHDTRTTLMIKNIPNKYTQKMLLTAIDDNHKGSYDFFYLPIDFKNQCNVGYAFINFIKPNSIVTFYREFNNKKWEKFNSDKVCLIAYARIQGKAALISHFQNSSLMCEDKKCRPIIFHSDGPNVGQQEPFPIGPNVRVRRRTQMEKERERRDRDWDRRERDRDLRKGRSKDRSRSRERYRSRSRGRSRNRRRSRSYSSSRSPSSSSSLSRERSRDRDTDRDHSSERGKSRDRERRKRSREGRKRRDRMRDRERTNVRERVLDDEGEGGDSEEHGGRRERSRESGRDKNRIQLREADHESREKDRERFREDADRERERGHKVRDKLTDSESRSGADMDHLFFETEAAEILTAIEAHVSV